MFEAADVRSATERRLRGLLGQAIAAAEDDGRPLGVRLHEMRTALKKARALLRLVHPLLGRRGRHERRNLAAVARSVGLVRDAGVIVETLDRVTGRGRRPSAVVALRGRLVAQRRKVERSGDTAKDLRRAKRALRVARRRTKGLLRRGNGRNALAAGLSRGYRRARLAMEEANRRDTAEAFHAWRKAVKDHSFHVDVLVRAGVADLRERGDRLDALAAILGAAHDLTLLDGGIRADRRRSGRPRAHGGLLKRVRARQRGLHAAAKALGRRLFAERPRATRQLVLDSPRLTPFGKDPPS
jgi:CHAD domain-containing protein